MPRQLQPLPADEAAALRAARVDGALDRAGERALVKHCLALLQQRAPGGSVEVRVPPYAAVQVVPGVRHTRGTPPAVVEMDAATWLSLALGERSWAAALEEARVAASGERADLSAYLPLA